MRSHLSFFASRHIVLAGTVAALLACNLAARAANKTWDGGSLADSLWQTGANWDLDTAPTGNDALFFAGATRLAAGNDFVANSLFNGITFNAGAGAFTLSGNALTLTPGLAGAAGAVTGGNATNNSISTETINLPVTLAAGNHTFVTAAGSESLNFTGALTRAANSTAVFTKNGGNFNFTGSGLANDANGILGGWAIIGNDFAALDGGGNIAAYAAYTPIAAGAITSGSTFNYKYSVDSGNITAADGTTINSLVATIGVNRSLTITGTMKLGTKGGIYRTGASTANSVMTVTGGTLTANGGGDITLADATNTAANFAATNNNLTVASVIANDGANVVSVNVIGYVIMSGANTFSGGTFINQGRVQASNAAAFGNGGIVTVNPGAEAFLNNNGTFANNFVINGIGATEASGGQQLGAIRMNTGGTVISGQITLATNSRISGGSGGNNVISGKITGPGRLEFTAATGNNGSITLSNANNDWNGGLLVTVGGATRQVYLKLGASEVIPDGAGKGDVTIAGTSDIARLDLNGFSETINGLNSTVSGNNQVANFGAGTPVLTLGNNNASGSFGGTISASMALTKIGSGTQTLGGANTYTGDTNINAGALSVTGSLASAGNVNVSAGATFSGTGSAGNVTLAADSGANIARIAPGATGAVGSIGTLSLASLTLNGGDLAFDLAGTNDLINVTGTASFAAASTITPSSNAPNGTYTVLTSGTLTLGVAPTVVQPTDTRKTFTPDYSIANTILLTVAGTSKTLNWTGLTNGVWDLKTTVNWNDTVIDEKYFNGDTVNFGDGPVNRAITITGITVTPESVNVNNSAGNDYTIGGTGGIGGSAALTKDGAGTLILTGNNSYTGATTINSGTLQIGDGGALGATAITNNATLAVNRSDASTLSNAISGTGALTKSGNGTRTLTGANSYDGATTVNAGTLKVSSSASVGTLIGGAVNIVSGATLDLSGNATAQALNFGAKQFNIAGTGAGGIGAIVNNGVSQFNALQHVTLTADATVAGSARFDIRSVPTSALNASLDLAGNTLTKSGTNQFSLVGTNVSDGNIVVNQGTFSIETVTNIPDFGSGKTITFNAGTIAQFFGNTAAVSTVLRPMVFNGAGIQIGSASNNNNSIIGSPMTLNGDVIFAALNNTTASSTLTLTGNLTETGGARSITKTGPSTLVLSGANQWSGATFIQNGTFRIGSATAFPPLANVTLGSVGNSGVLDLGGFDAYLSGLTVSGTGTANIVGSSGTATDSVLYFANGSSTFRGTIQNVTGTGSRVVSLDVLSGTLALTGANTYSGGTSIEGGTLNINADAALGDAGGGVTISGGISRLQAGATFISTRTVTLGVAGGTIDTNGNDITLAAGGTVTGTSLTKTGAGTLTLAGTQTYATLNSSGGTTHVDSALGTGTSTVNAGANTDFSVSQTLAALNISNGAKVTLGSGIGPALAPDMFVAAAAPEPGAMGLLLLGALGILGRRSRRGRPLWESRQKMIVPPMLSYKSQSR